MFFNKREIKCMHLNKEAFFIMLEKRYLNRIHLIRKTPKNVMKDIYILRGGFQGNRDLNIEPPTIEMRKQLNIDKAFKSIIGKEFNTKTASIHDYLGERKDVMNRKRQENPFIVFFKIYQRAASVFMETYLTQNGEPDNVIICMQPK